MLQGCDHVKVVMMHYLVNYHVHTFFSHTHTHTTDGNINVVITKLHKAVGLQKHH